MLYRKRFKPRDSCARHTEREQKIKDKLMLLGLLCHSTEQAFNKALRINEKSMDGSQVACAFKEFRHIFWKLLVMFSRRITQIHQFLSCFTRCIK